MDLEKYALEFKNGNQNAFDVLYKETFPLVRFVIYSYIPNKTIVEDLVQDTYMKVNKNIGKYESTNFKNWVFTIGKNIALDYIKKRKEVLLDDSDQISQEAITHPYLKYVLSHLDDALREVFLLKVLCGHTTKKIALLLEKKPAEVNQMYYQAKRILKERLKGDFNEIKSTE